jgi:hypothetical protein
MSASRQLGWLLLCGAGLGLVDESLAAGPETLATVTQRAEARGLRLREVRWDAVLQQRWAVLEDVAHPGRPLIAELTNAGLGASGTTEVDVHQIAALQTVEVAVHYGDRVVLWSAQQNVRMQMAAVAEGDAAVGSRVQLRVTGAGVNGDMGWRVTGIVRGLGSVEMEH